MTNVNQKLLIQASVGRGPSLPRPGGCQRLGQQQHKPQMGKKVKRNGVPESLL